MERSPVERPEEGIEVALFMLDRWVTLALPRFANVIFNQFRLASNLIIKQ